MDKKKLCWYINRFSKMSLKEIFWRLDVLVNQPDLRKIQRIPQDLAAKQLARELPPLGARSGNAFAASEEETRRVVERAEKILRREFEFFGKAAKLPENFSWLRDPLNGAETPRKDFLELNYRDPEAKASVMRIWFLNRHTHLVTLAQAYALTKREEFAREIVAELKSWLMECHYPYGLPWITSMEAAVRLLAWTFMFRFLGDERPACFDDLFVRDFFTSVKRHYAYVKFNRSRYSSANNHALAELAALVCAREIFPLLFEEEKEDLADELMKEAEAQFSESGANLEQAFSYHAFSLELLCAAAAQSGEFLGKARELFYKAAVFLARANEIMPLCGEYGDSDEAVATGILTREGDYYGQVAKLAYAFASPEPKESGVVTEDHQWYTGTEIQTPPVYDLSDYSADCGFFWKGRTEDGLTFSLFFKTGPLGLGKLAAHGHADTLSFLMSVNGTPVFVDSGTGAYHQNKRWRNYFRSSAAHNTMVVNDQDQSLSLGPFMWRENYKTVIETRTMTEKDFDLSARHYGYKKRFNLTHVRGLQFSAEKRELTVTDAPMGCDNVNIKQYFHVSDKCEVTQTGSKTFLVKGPDFKLELTFMHVLSAKLAAGDEATPLGFASAHLGEWSPCPVIVTEANCIGNDSLISKFVLKPL